jgi:hypothetical protein
VEQVLSYRKTNHENSVRDQLVAGAVVLFRNGDRDGAIGAARIFA